MLRPVPLIVLLLAATGCESKPPPIPPPAPVVFESLAGFPVKIDPALTEPKAAERAVDAQIPVNVKGFAGRKVSFKGYIFPYDVDETTRKLRHFLLSRVEVTCCLGDKIKINDWIDIDPKNVGYVPAVMNVKVMVEGTLEVGAVAESDGYIGSIYRIVAEKVEQIFD